MVLLANYEIGAVIILLVYVMMVLTFNSLVTPFVILFTLPLALVPARRRGGSTTTDTGGTSPPSDPSGSGADHA